MFWERFYHLCLSHNTRPNPVGKEIGISSSVITHWKQDGSYPTIELLLKIADYFDCSIDYLIGRSNEKSSNIEISIDDFQLIEKFHSLDDNGKRELISYLDFKIDQRKKGVQTSCNSIDKNLA